MVGSKKKGKGKKRLDTFYDLAKRQGYRARSAFKLIQLNRKYEFLQTCNSVIDLCAAPGGWMQVAQQYMPVGSTVVGVDLSPIKAIPGCKAILGDIYSDKTKKAIEQALKGTKAEVVLHDGAPNVGGVWLQEVFAQQQLVLQALKISTQHLAPDGWFITKVFRSENFNSLLWVLKQLFKKVESTKPVASRSESAEIYVICSGYRNPQKVDPKFFKVNEVFSEVDESNVNKIVSDSPYLEAITQTQDVTRNLRSRCCVSDFVHSSDPQHLLKHVNEISFNMKDEVERKYHDSTFTSKEVLFICEDVKQASDADIKRLIRWRDRLRGGTLIEEKKTVEEGTEVSNATHCTEEDLENELSALQKKKRRIEKKKMSKIVDRRLKHLGKVIHHDPNVVDDMGETNGTAKQLEKVAFGHEMPEIAEPECEQNITDNNSDDVSEESLSGNNADKFHGKVLSLLSSKSSSYSKALNLKQENPLYDVPATDDQGGDKHARRNPLGLSKPIGDIVQKKLEEDEIKVYQRKKTKTTDSEIALLDKDKRAETLALATKMLNPKYRESLLEDSINRHLRGEEDLPDWFLEDERRHSFQNKPITKQEIDFQKQRFMEINIRPSKKVAEAISRKRRKATRILRKVQQKGKTDPRMKEKGEKLSVRTLMRSKTLNKIHSKPMDNKMKGELYRNRQRKKARK